MAGQYLLDGQYFRPWGQADPGINLSLFATCEIILDVHQVTHTSAGRIAGGILGALVAGPIGAAAGLMTGGKKQVDETQVFCSLTDGRGFKARCNREDAAALKAALFAAQNAKTTYSKRQSDNAASGISTKKLKLKIEGESDKECPQCAEMVKARAKICRFCRHVFDENDKQKMPEKLTKDPEFEKFISAFAEYRTLANVDVEDKDLDNIYSFCKAVAEKFGPIHEDYELPSIAASAANYFSFNCQAYPDQDSETPDDESPSGMIAHIGVDGFAQCFTDMKDGSVEEGEMESFISSIFDKHAGGKR